MARLLLVLEPQLVCPHFGVTTGLLEEQAFQLLCRTDAKGCHSGTVTTTAGRISAVSAEGSYSSAVSRNIPERRQLALCEAWQASLVGPYHLPLQDDGNVPRGSRNEK